MVWGIGFGLCLVSFFETVFALGGCALQSFVTDGVAGGVSVFEDGRFYRGVQ